MSAEPRRQMNAEEYLAFERHCDTRHEYLEGELFAMGGASLRHNRVVRNLLLALEQRLVGRGCESFANDLRVHIPATGLFTYPDVVVVCGEPRLLDGEMDTLLNPVLLAEVLSASTEDYDRGRKFAHYRTLPSLRDYLLLAQDKAHAEHFSRQPEDRWLLVEAEGPEAILDLPALGCRLPLAEIYSDTSGSAAKP